MRWTQYSLFYFALIAGVKGIALPFSGGQDLCSDVPLDHSTCVQNCPSGTGCVSIHERSGGTRSQVHVPEAEYSRMKESDVDTAWRKPRTRKPRIKPEPGSVIETNDGTAAKPKRKETKRATRISARLQNKKASPAFNEAKYNQYVGKKLAEAAAKKPALQERKTAAKIRAAKANEARANINAGQSTAVSSLKAITTNHLRGSGYRQKAIDNSPHDKAFYKGKYAADHLLELQSVARHINQGRPNAIEKKAKSPECLKKLREDLNHPQNVAMVKIKTNSDKGFATTAFLKNKKTSHFTDDVRQHILTHQERMIETAQKVDQTMGSDLCGNLPPAMMNHVRHMVKIANCRSPPCQ